MTNINHLYFIAVDIVMLVMYFTLHGEAEINVLLLRTYYSR